MGGKLWTQTLNEQDDPPRATEGDAVGADVLGARRRVLIVDDEPAVARAIARAIGRDHAVQIVQSGREALGSILGGAELDLILCDLMMPDMTGMDLYAELKRLDHPAFARLVFMTGGAFTAEARAFLASVPNVRLDKPFNLRAVRDLLNALPARSAPR